MIYGFITFKFLPNLFYDKLSIYLLEKKQQFQKEENLKAAYDGSKDIIGMNQVLKKIFSFERTVFVSNQID